MKASNMNRRDFSRAYDCGPRRGPWQEPLVLRWARTMPRMTRNRETEAARRRKRPKTMQKTRKTKKKTAKRPPEYHVCRGLNGCKGNGADRVQ